MTIYDPLLNLLIVIVTITFALGVPLGIILRHNNSKYYSNAILSFSVVATSATLLIMYFLMKTRTLTGGFGIPDLIIPGLPLPHAFIVVGLGLLLAGLLSRCIEKTEDW